MLGYDTFANKLIAMVVSGTICAAAGAAYVILFGYVGSTLASVQYSILPLLWVLLGGAATTLGPLVGTLLMYYRGRRHQRLHLRLPADRRRRAHPAGALFSRKAFWARSASAGRGGCHDAAAHHTRARAVTLAG